MSDLIRREELLDLYKVKEEYKDYSVPLPVIIQNIKDMPAVDAVEVVRCKDCKHLRVLDFDNVYARCYRTNCMFYQQTHTLFAIDARTHYCSLGERREENAVD